MLLKRNDFVEADGDLVQVDEDVQRGATTFLGTQWTPDGPGDEQRDDWQ